LCDCIPLCRWHYKLNAQSYHALGRRRFEQVHEVSIREILERLHRRPQIRIFVAAFDREDYRLGTSSQGALTAFKTFRKIRMEMV
jgi:hypothetical protein